MDGKPARRAISSAGAAAEGHIIPRKSAAPPAASAKRPRSGIMRG